MHYITLRLHLHLHRIASHCMYAMLCHANAMPCHACITIKSPGVDGIMEAHSSFCDGSTVLLQCDDWCADMFGYYTWDMRN